MVRKETIFTAVLILIGLVITFFAFAENFENIDIFHTKNISYHNRKIEKIRKSDDIEFVKREVIEFISNSNYRNSQTSERAVKISKLLIVVFLGNLIALIFLLFRLIKKHPTTIYKQNAAN